MLSLANNRCFLLWISLLIFFSCKPNDHTNEDLTEKIDDLFHEWDNDESPGAAVAILRDGEVIFKKGYGMANLEYGIPITPSSIFHIASESKQFTNYCIVLLAREGKLSLEDDIRKYLPELPDFGKKITIKNLIHHTSGLRDQWQLLAISGTRLDDVITQEHILKLMKKQRSLNFEPGERHLYCNSGYTLLGEIVKRVSGQTMREFAEKEIFQPLGMKHTHFHDNYREIVKQRVYSYEPMDNKSFANSILSYSTVGATSLFTTVEDEAKWLNNYYTAQVGGKEAIDQMYELGVLNAGDTLNYAFGLGIDTYKGWKRIGHGGGDAGFRTYAVRFPEENLGIVVFSNVSNFNPYPIAMRVADLFLEDKSVKKDPQDRQVIDKSSYIPFLGKYYNDEGSLLEIIDSTNLYVQKNGGVEEMVPVSDSTFTIFDGYGLFTFRKHVMNQFSFHSGNDTYLFRKYETYKPTTSDLESYQGIFRNDETDTQYEIIADDNRLMLGHSKYEEVALTPITRNQFSSPHWWMDNIIFHRDGNDKISGFEVNNGRVLHLYFKKLI